MFVLLLLSVQKRLKRARCRLRCGLGWVVGIMCYIWSPAALKDVAMATTFWLSMGYNFGFRATVCKTVRPMLSDRCLSVCSVCNVNVLWPNGWTDQNETCHAGRPRPGHIVLDGEPAPPPPKRHSPPILGPYLLRPNGSMDQDATWYGGRSRPRRLCVRWGPRSLLKKGAEPPKYSAHIYCGQTARWINMVLGTEVGLGPGEFVLDNLS